MFSFNNRLYSQIDGCGIGNPLSPLLVNIFKARRGHCPSIWTAILQPIHRWLLKRNKIHLIYYLNDLTIITQILISMSRINTWPLLDTGFKYQDRSFHRHVFCKPGKVPTHWSSKVSNGNEIASWVPYTEPNKYLLTLNLTSEKSLKSTSKQGTLRVFFKPQSTVSVVEIIMEKVNPRFHVWREEKSIY